jgi:hypothetical protein
VILGHLHRRLKALELVEQREGKSLEVALLKEHRIEERERQEGSRAPQELSRTRADEFQRGGDEATRAGQGSQTRQGH